MFWNRSMKNAPSLELIQQKVSPRLHFTAANSLFGAGFSKGLWPLLCVQRVIKAGASREPESRQNWPLKFCSRPVRMAPRSILTDTNDFWPLPSSLVSCHCELGIHLLPWHISLGQRDCVLSYYDYCNLPLWPAIFFHTVNILSRCRFKIVYIINYFYEVCHLASHLSSYVFTKLCLTFLFCFIS